MALPGQGKTFEAFQQEDFNCRGFAQQQAGYPQPGQAATNGAIGGAALGSAVGAGIGAAIGAATGTAASGAAIGAASGLVGGGLLGANKAGSEAQFTLQQRYDIAYTQCMYAHGNAVASPPGGYAYGYGYPAYANYWPNISLGFGWWGWGGGHHGWHHW
jgi:hypothetical protein